ncbi:DUF1801 domain-containing protein [Emticicia soli]|uniref:DUF1801 domain-containing protein n=1 Tax=Emticicia soli TaxID=2027878 RepID=A0ABW5J070_9BACT
MLSPIDTYFEQQEEPIKSCLLFLRTYILKQSPAITEAWKYKMPVYYYKGKMFCYLWRHKKYTINGIHQPYIGIVDGNKINDVELIAENRTRMKILLIDPTTDIPIETLERLFKTMIQFRGRNSP